jgi:hypothetical protein
MSEKPNDSPAFRLRPRAEPKSYYSIRLEYSANPAAFTRERPRSNIAKKRSSSNKSSYSRAKQQSNKLTAAAQSVLRHDNYAPVSTLPPIKLENVLSKEDIEREERRKQLRRDTSRSITTDTMISPFMQRLSVDELKPSKVYDQNYITLKIEKVTREQQAGDARACVMCQCSTVSFDDEADDDDDDIKPSGIINVRLYDEYADEKLLEVGKILNIAKFKTGSDRPTGNHAGEPADNNLKWYNFDVIVGYDEIDSAALASPPPFPSLPITPPLPSPSTTMNGGANQRKMPLIPFVSITSMIEQPTEPFVEMAPPSPPSLPNKKDH